MTEPEENILLKSTPHGFMLFESMEKMMKFSNRLKSFSLSLEDVFSFTNECVSSLRGEFHGKTGAENAASILEKALEPKSQNEVERAQAVCNKCVYIYTLECFLYSEMNARLRNMESLADGSIDTIMKAVRKTCGPLAAYVFLLWEGLRMMFASAHSGAKITLYRGMRLPLDSFQALCAQEGSFVVIPNFTSFSNKLSVALGFPCKPMSDPTREVDPILELESFSRPLIKAMSQFTEEGEVLMHPFSVFKVVSCTNPGPNGRPVVKLCDIEILKFIPSGGVGTRKVEFVIMVEGKKFKQTVVVGQVVNDLIADMNQELKRTDLCELWDGDCMILGKEIVADHVMPGHVLTLRPKHAAPDQSQHQPLLPVTSSLQTTFLPPQWSSQLKSPEVVLTDDQTAACTQFIEGFSNDRNVSVGVVLHIAKITEGVVRVRVRLDHPGRLHWTKKLDRLLVKWDKWLGDDRWTLSDYYGSYLLPSTCSMQEGPFGNRFEQRDLRFGVCSALPANLSNFNQSVSNASCVFYAVKDRAVFSKGSKVKEAVGQFKSKYRDDGDALTMEVDVAHGRLSFVLNGKPLASVDEPLIAGGVFVYASMDGYNNLFPRIVVESVKKLQ